MSSSVAIIIYNNEASSIEAKTAHESSYSRPSNYIGSSAKNELLMNFSVVCGRLLHMTLALHGNRALNDELL